MTDPDKAARIKAAIDKLKKPDKIGLAGETLGTGAGMLMGQVSAGAVAHALLGSSILGSASIFLFGPPAWIVAGSVIGGGVAAYGIGKMIKSGAKQDQIRQELIKTLQGRLDVMRQQKALSQVSLRALKLALSEAMRRELIGAERAERMVSLVEEQKLKIDVALERVRAINEVRQVKM